MALEAVIFDMDGVLSDTQKLHAQAQSKILEEYGVEMSPEEITRKYAGKPPGTLFREESPASNPMEAYGKKQDVLYELVEKEGVKPIEGSQKLIREIEGNYKLGVASSSEPDFIEEVVDSLGLSKYFEVIKSASEVPKGKPAPDVFLETADELGLNPEDCLVIEDGRSGMKGATEAGMVCIGLVDESGEYPAHKTVNSLSELDTQSIEEIYSENSK
ncbi:HAD family hydrolase [Candidatus Nanohalobium constans]|uniref:Beta-phosphoglucomutase n=1 Tax=Candidatus Nanohalobium constans TaxID=2565781 RepID=A0A5Q0UHM2_9ARCH|nr:HAD family phosphatase [Candidatus Nanohalobium constans]QGA80435.1 beta-phosphoglucomutase [Candidatus Nanohalobium constans]